VTQDKSNSAAPEPAYDETLGLLAAALPRPTPTSTTRTQLLDALRSRERWTPWAAAVARLLGITELDSQHALQQIEERAGWRPGLWPSSSIMQTPALAAVQALFARLSPATRIARHNHSTRELTFVLDGELIEDDRRSYGPGELVDMQVGSEHELTVAGTSDCLVVFFLPRA
jgi:anti-sigma factor ChrR (cupin superfamily)